MAFDEAFVSKQEQMAAAEARAKAAKLSPFEKEVVALLGEMAGSLEQLAGTRAADNGNGDVRGEPGDPPPPDPGSPQPDLREHLDALKARAQTRVIAIEGDPGYRAARNVGYLSALEDVADRMKLSDQE